MNAEVKIRGNLDPAEYEKLFEHVSNLRKAVILTAPRAGSDFFQSLLDGHPEIMQIPGQFQFYDFWSAAVCKEDLEDLTEEFIWRPSHVVKFKSRYDKQERWDLLGEERNEGFEVDLGEFRRHFRAIMSGREVSSRNFFLAAHLAYALANGQSNLPATKLMVCHIHEYYHLAPFHADFPDYSVIYCTRDPRNALVSSVENIMRDYGQMNLDFFRFWLVWIFTESEQALPFTKRVKTLPLEHLHGRSEMVLKEFCGDFDLQFDACLFRSTWQNKQWWGDKRSKRFLKNFNQMAGDAQWKGKLNRVDLFLIESLLGERMRAYGYEPTRKPARWHLWAAPFVMWIPMRYERQIAAYDWRTKEAALCKCVSLITSAIYYCARVVFYFRCWRNRIAGREYVAASYGTKKGRAAVLRGEGEKPANHSEEKAW